jgi:predicted alpha/beta superfamily hydrolase
MDRVPLQLVPSVRTHLIHSKYIGQAFKVQVMQPLQLEGGGARFPVLYATDGNLTFDLFKGISYVLQESGREVQPYILVSIGYPSDCP